MNEKVCIIGLGYVGLPLMVEVGRYYHVIGYDINEIRVKELSEGYDRTSEINFLELQEKNNLRFTSDINDCRDSTFFIVTVPTPVDKANRPDFDCLKNASKLLGGVLKKGDCVVYESTVYPGATEEICIPILEHYSKLKAELDFDYGYSPERVNPGDPTRGISNIKKVVSGSTHFSLERVSNLYSKIVRVGIHKASSIKVAEAAKVIENIQRDVNIALMNELSLIFDRVDVDTLEVIEAASTKWNFMPFKPGLVGGHCIGVDPYYLAEQSIKTGYFPELILAGRKVNEDIARFVAEKTIRLLIERRGVSRNTRVLIMGATFKENCPDLRNSKVKSVIDFLFKYGLKIEILDPVANRVELNSEYLSEVTIVDNPSSFGYDAIIVSVAHDAFRTKYSIESLRSFLLDNGILFDLKGMFQTKDGVDARL